MGGTTLIWAVILIVHIGAKSYAGILVLRFLLGMAEAGISPCSEYWKHKPPVSKLTKTDRDYNHIHVLQAQRTAPPSIHLAKRQRRCHDAGSPTRLWPRPHAQHPPPQLATDLFHLRPAEFRLRLRLPCLIPESPSTAHFFSHKQRIVAVQRVVTENMIGMKTKQLKPHQTLEIARDPKTLCCIAIGAACGVINAACPISPPP